MYRNLAILCILVVLACHYGMLRSEIVEGIVYHDINRNSHKDAGEPGIANILVSNQESITKTDAVGHYSLEIQAEDIIFVIKPPDFDFPLNENNLPKFYYVHSPQGSPPLKYKGLDPTGPLPKQIDFPLHASGISDTFEVIVFSDPQPRNEQEINYIRDDILSELVGSSASCGIVLGDIMYDNLSLYDYYLKNLGKVGIPFYHVPGNHDTNYDASDDPHSLETYKSHFGPPYYGFQYGKVHFITLDVIDYLGYNDQGNPHYQGKISEKQLHWLRNYLDFIPQDHLIVLNMHIPLYTFIGSHVSVQVTNREHLFDLLQDHPNTLALAGHMHMIEHQFLGEDSGWQNSNPLHQIICGAVSGSWWSGPPDIRGIPVADQRDGGHNGYHIFSFQGNSFKERYIPAQLGEQHQLRISSPIGSIQKSEADSISIIVNVFDGNEKTRVVFQIDQGASVTMSRKTMIDPFTQSLHAQNEKFYENWITPRPTNHIWSAPLPDNLEAGIHTITVIAVNQWGEKFQSSRIIEIY
ncbi:MAG: calcineurin-like phosphoesterase C-terminal domain-containing protein [bacterium]|nr:MAG: calcineurin-like phosphoesterase C-terminal domain-containing protein [bacterium]